MTRRGVARAALAALLFGASTPFAAQLAQRLDAFTLAGLLYLGAALAVLPSVLRRPPERRSLRRGWRRLAVAVVLGGAVGPVLLALGLQRTGAASASLLLNLELVFTVVVAATVFREHIGTRVAAGAGLVALAGVLLAGTAGAGDARMGALLVAGACLAWAVDNSVTAELDELTPAQITFVKGLVAGTVNTVIGLAAGRAPEPGLVIAVLVVGALGYGASITLWVASARELGAARAQVIFATAPFLGAALAWTVFGDPVVTGTLVGCVLAGAGVGLVVRSGHTHSHRHPAVEHDHEHEHGEGHHDHVHPDGFTGRHQHPHRHEELLHEHAHVPDLHHRHAHDGT